MGLIADLAPGPIAIDTAAVIYFIEEHPRFLRVIRPLFVQADEGRRELVTSVLTLLEVLVVPYRARNLSLAERYETLLTRGRGIRLVDVSRDLLRVAAQLRATTTVGTPDAVQLAAAIAANCTTFVTNDRRLPDVAGLRVIQLSSYAA
ncbi:MAG TPA: PIN domain-containing protein [Vicinamibacterales bacterium]|nr:PIN domain-containing protein [Vicinamibacterales bacterium]